jgi:hypothetical protein
MKIDATFTNNRDTWVKFSMGFARYEISPKVSLSTAQHPAMLRLPEGFPDLSSPLGWQPIRFLSQLLLIWKPTSSRQSLQVISAVMPELTSPETFSSSVLTACTSSAVASMTLPTQLPMIRQTTLVLSLEERSVPPVLLDGPFMLKQFARPCQRFRTRCHLRQIILQLPR